MNGQAGDRKIRLGIAGGEWLKMVGNATARTNFANNVVIGAIFVSLILFVTGSMALDPMPFIATLVICCSLAFLTPAGSPVTAFVFANHKWVKTGDIYKYASIFMCISFVITAVVGLIWASVIF